MQDRYRVSDITFADDINILTNTREDLIHQATKLSRYANWAHLTVNNTKSTVTAALHKTYTKTPYDDRVIRMQLEHNTKVQGKNITYHPPKEPFRHLGVLLTMDLNYKYQLTATIEKSKR